MAWAEGLPAALRNAAMNMRAGMKDLGGEPSSLYSQVAKYRFKNPGAGEGSSAGVSITVESNAVSAGTLSSNVKNLEKASATVDSQSKNEEGQSTTSQDGTGTSSTGEQEQLGSTDDGSKEPDVPTGAQVDTKGETDDAKILEETTKSLETAGDTSGSSVSSKDTAVTSETSKNTSSPSSPRTSEEGPIGLTEFLGLVRDNNVRQNNGNTTDPVSSYATVASTLETGSKSGTEDQTKTMTSDDEKSSEVATSQDDKQSGMIYTMTR